MLDVKFYLMHSVLSCLLVRDRADCGTPTLADIWRRFDIEAQPVCQGLLLGECFQKRNCSSQLLETDKYHPVWAILISQKPSSSLRYISAIMERLSIQSLHDLKPLPQISTDASNGLYAVHSTDGCSLTAEDNTIQYKVWFTTPVRPIQTPSVYVHLPEVI